MHSNATIRRLALGKKAMEADVTGLKDKSRDELDALYTIFSEGARALQSLDDLDDPEENDKAWSDMNDILGCLQLVRDEIEYRDAGAVVASASA